MPGGLSVETKRKLTAILAADVVGYARLMGADEAGTLTALKRHRRELIDPKIAEHHGRIVKLVGDGMLIEFPSVVDAVRCAAYIQGEMRSRTAAVPPDRRIEFRVGINLGDVIVEGEDIYGDGVNLAARLEGVAEPGGIAVSRAVRDHVGNRLDLEFEDRGELALKNIEEPVHVFSVIVPAKGHGAPAGQPVAAKPEKPSIAVLPFDNMSGDPEQEYFSDGITEDIITDLSRISALFVVARNSAFTYKDKAVKVQQACRELGVRYILEGSVRKAGGRVRVTAQLIDGPSGGHLWAERYDRDLTDIFAIQDEITHSIVDNLKVQLLPKERNAIAAAPTENVEAYSFYLRGRQFLHRHSKSYYNLARRMFAKAVELDPLFARAYAGIADCDSFLSLNYDESVSIDSILATSAKALDLDQALAEAHASRGLALSLGKRYPEAMAEFERALSLDPNLFETYYFYARACFAQGLFEKAAQLFERAGEVKPDDYQSPLLNAGVYRSLGRLEDEIRATREGVERAERELKAHPENARAAVLGAGGLISLGEVARGREWAARALSIDPDDVLTQYNVACAYSLAGEVEPAIDLLEKLLPRANHESKAWFKNDSDLDPIRSHPRYQDLLKLAD
jgi:adenylate cyclase